MRNSNLKFLMEICCLLLIAVQPSYRGIFNGRQLLLFNGISERSAHSLKWRVILPISANIKENQIKLNLSWAETKGWIYFSGSSYRKWVKHLMLFKTPLNLNLSMCTCKGWKFWNQTETRKDNNTIEKGKRIR